MTEPHYMVLVNLELARSSCPWTHLPTCVSETVALKAGATTPYSQILFSISLSPCNVWDNVVVWICLAYREWYCSEVWPCWGKCYCGGGFWKSSPYSQAPPIAEETLLLAAHETIFWWPSDYNGNPPSPCLLGLHHAPALLIIHWTSEPGSQP